MSPIIIFSLSQKLFFPSALICIVQREERDSITESSQCISGPFTVNRSSIGNKRKDHFRTFFPHICWDRIHSETYGLKSSTITLDLIYSRNGNRVLATLPRFLGKLTVIFRTVPLPRCSTSSHMKNVLISFQTPVLRNVYDNCSTWNYSMCLKGEQRSVLVNCRFLSAFCQYMAKLTRINYHRC